MIDYISAYKSQIAFKGLDFVADRPRINAELRVMMADAGVLKNFPNFTGEHLCWYLSLLKLQTFSPAALLK